MMGFKRKSHTLYFVIWFVILLVISSNQTVQSQDLSAGLVAKYAFSGNTNNEIGSNNGINHGAQLTTDRFGNFNSAYYFDGFSSYIEIPDNDLLDFAYDENFSVSVWVNISTFQNDMGGTNNEILGKWDTNRSQGYPYAIRYWNENATEENRNKIFDLRYDTENCGHNPLITGSCSISRDEWHHLAFVKNGSVLTFYQDGELFGTTTDNTTSTCNTLNNHSIFIGKREINRRNFTGSIDDILFYDRALTPEEIVLLVSENGWTVPPLPDTDILIFRIPNQVSSAIDIASKKIEVLMPCYSDLSQLVPSFSVSDGSEAYVNNYLQISGSSVNDFSLPITFTVSNSNYCNHSDWVVNVEHQTFSQDYVYEVTSFISFSLEGQISTSLDHTNHTINVLLPCFADLTKLTAVFSLMNNSKAVIGDKQQVSGVNTNNFSDTVIYTITNSETCSEQEWNVKAELQTFSQDYIDLTTSFLSYGINGQTQPTEIDTILHQIKIVMPCGEDLTNLKSSFVLANGSKAEIDGIGQESIITPNDFSNIQTYTIKSSEGCFATNWDVIVSIDLLNFETINFSNANYFIPNVLTPNSDGKNDIFRIGELFQGSEVKIFNRHGIKVFESELYKNQFSGSELASGVYYYWIKSACLEEPIIGPLSILN